MALPSKTWQRQPVPRVAGASGLQKVGCEWGDLGSSDNRNSYVRMYMHEGCVSGIILEDFPLLSLAYEEHIPKSEWNRQILCSWPNPYILIS